MFRSLVFLLLFFACSTAHVSEHQFFSDQSITISDVTIFNVRDGSLMERKTLILDSGMIQGIYDSDSDIPHTHQTIEGSGKFIIPGLSEMHAHIPSPNNGREYIEDILFLYLSNGITTVRGMLGHPIHLEYREKAQNSNALIPTIYSSSPSLNGSSVQSREEARSKINSYADDGYDFLKLHPGIKLDVFEEIVKVANDRKIPFAGHVSVDVGIRRALESQYASIDHVDGYLEGLVPEDAGVDPEANGFFGYNFTDLADTSKISELVALTRENMVWVVPTQSLFDRWFSPRPGSEYAGEPEMKYMPKSMIENWVRSKEQLIGSDNYDPKTWERFNSIRKKLILKLHRNGYGLLLGSDAPQVFNVPGFSIHHEMQGMKEAGLTNLEIIQTGTMNCAKYLGLEGKMGEIKVGAQADLILLEKNPLEDLDHLKKPAGVFLRGIWLSRNEIDERLLTIERKFKDQ
jgi:hypothetical protein